MVADIFHAAADPGLDPARPRRLLGVVAVLGRIQGGRYLRPVITLISKVPIFRRGLQKASNAALERSNPELASAMKKMQRFGRLRDPNRAQAAMSQLTGRSAAHSSRCRRSRA